ncbi:SDR family oxidoreductase [Paraburkholderia terrae]|uniref:SDR family oxidoreductase n=1 Tax=Paraburkholderia terrae TaxID=311230 RepID=UPI002FDCBD23
MNLSGFYHITQLAIAEMANHSTDNVVSVTASVIECVFRSRGLDQEGSERGDEVAAIKYARKGIRVNAVAPGIINSPMHARESHKTLGTMHPLGRMGDMSDIYS